MILCVGFKSLYDIFAPISFDFIILDYVLWKYITVSLKGMPPWNYETYMYISHALLNCCLFSSQDEFLSIQQTVTMLSYLLIAIGAAVDVLTLVYIFIKWRQSRAPNVCLFCNYFL